MLSGRGPSFSRYCALMAIEVALIVLDMSPLITLAAAERLDYLLYPELPVIIPDAVFYEATRQIDRLGAQEILAWHHDRQEKVRIEPTEAFKNEVARLTVQGGRMTRDLGERAAVEVIRNYPLGDPQRAVLLTDDRCRARRHRTGAPDRTAGSMKARGTEAEQTPRGHCPIPGRSK